MSFEPGVRLGDEAVGHRVIVGQDAGETSIAPRKRKMTPASPQDARGEARFAPYLTWFCFVGRHRLSHRRIGW